MMIENFEKDYKSVIEQHLPSHLSKTLQDKLSEAEKLQKENKELNSKLELLTTVKIEHEAEISKLYTNITELKSREMDLISKEIELRTKEKDLEMREIRVLNEIVRKEMAQKQAEDFKNVLTTVFANKQVFETITETQGGRWEWNSVKGANEFIPDGYKNVNIVKS